MKLLNQSDDSKQTISYTTTPFSAKRSKHNLFIYGNIGHIETSADMFKWLTEINPGDELNIYINSEGGAVATATSLIRHISDLDIEVNIHVSGICQSSASIILFGLYDKAKNVVIDPYTIFLFHGFKSSGAGKVVDNKAALDIVSKMQDKIYKDLMSGILTKEELLYIKNGQDVYLLGCDVVKRIEE